MGWPFAKIERSFDKISDTPADLQVVSTSIAPLRFASKERRVRAQCRRTWANWFHPKCTEPLHLDAKWTMAGSGVQHLHLFFPQNHTKLHTHTHHPDSIQHGWSPVGSGANCCARALMRATAKNYQGRFGDRPRRSAAQPQNRQGLARFSSALV